MKITIHRGINQIGGCITEIASDQTRILIDLGQNLPDGQGSVEDSLANDAAVAKLTKGVDAIFYTHYHGDHMGLFHYVPSGTRQYMGQVAKEVALCKHRHLAHIKGREELSHKEIEQLNAMATLTPGQAVQVGDIRVIPYLVSHSAYDAYLFLVEVEGKRVLHTGDFRGHGYLSKGLIPTLQQLILPRGEIDFLITEGTMLSRLDEQVMSEYELQVEAEKLMTRYKNVFVLCSSTDMERLASFYAANKKQGNRPVVCDSFQQEVLALFSESAGKYASLFQMNPVFTFHPKNVRLVDWMVDKGFCMFVRATDKFADYYRLLADRLKPQDTVLIYARWRAYIEAGGPHVNQSYRNFVSLFPRVEQLHTSGHASAAFLAEVCNLVNPRMGIIPVHSEHSADYINLPIYPHLQRKVLTSSTVLAGVNVDLG